MVVQLDYKQSTNSREERNDCVESCARNRTNPTLITATTSEAVESNSSLKNENNETSQKLNGEKYLEQCSSNGPQSIKSSSTFVNMLSTTLTNSVAVQSSLPLPVAINDQQLFPNSAHLLPKAMLICRPNSHPFQERKLTVDSKVKIGRAVARSKPNVDNAIFDCKVLSRNHAVLWYDNGKFFLQDTKSSNGTFVNSHRLSTANEESQPKELSSGDVVQFGVDVVENTKKVTHGCIIATVHLYHPDGSEAKVSNEYSVYGANGHLSAVSASHPVASFSSQNLYLLAQCLKEALHREEILKNKLNSLQAVMNATQELSESSWKSMVEEDRLISKIESLQDRLESLLNANCSNDTEGKVSLLKQELMKLHDEKEKVEIAAKQAIQKSLEEKMSSFSRIYELEASLKSVEIECNRLKDLCNNLEKDISLLTDKDDKQIKDLNETQNKAKEAEEKISHLADALKQEKNKFENIICDMKHRETELQELVDNLTKQNEAHSLQIELLKQQLDISKQEICSSAASPKEVFTELSHTNKFNDIVDNEISNSKLEQQLVNSISVVDNENNLDDEKSSSLTNGEIGNHEKASSSLSSDEINVNATSQLVSEIEAMQKLLSEARYSKKMYEDKVICLESEVKELLSLNEELRTEAKANETRLNNAKNELELKIKLCESTLNRVLVLEEQLKIMQKDYDVLSNQYVDLKTSNQCHTVQTLNTKCGVQSDFNITNDESNRTSSEADYNIYAEVVKPSNRNDTALHWCNSDATERLSFENNAIQESEIGVAFESENVFVTPGNEDGPLTVSLWKQKLRSVSREISEKQAKLEAIELQLLEMKKECDTEKEAHQRLREDFKFLKEENELISYQNKTATACALVPLFILLLAVVLAYYPSISVVTGTIES